MVVQETEFVRRQKGTLEIVGNAFKNYWIVKAPGNASTSDIATMFNAVDLRYDSIVFAFSFGTGKY